VSGPDQTKADSGHSARKHTWILRDPKEVTVRRILSLLSWRNGDKTSLMARLKTTPWSRKMQAMVRNEQLQEPPSAPEAESAPAGQLGLPGEAHGRKEQSDGFGRSNAEKWPSCVSWSRSWEMSLVHGMTNVNLSPSPCRQMTATWLREQGDWTGANSVKEDWVLLAGPACEIARAETHSNLQKAREPGTVRANFQSQAKRGHLD